MRRGPWLDKLLREFWTDCGRDSFGVTPIVEELPRIAAKRNRVAAVRRLADRDNRNPAGPKASHAQPP